MLDFENLEGNWYLPGSKIRVHGILSYDPIIGGILDLDISPSFHPLKYDSQTTYYYDIILGECNGKKITLNKCIENRTNIEIKSQGMVIRTQFYIRTIFIGDHIQNANDLIFQDFSFNLYNVGFWFSGLTDENYKDNLQNNLNYVIRKKSESVNISVVFNKLGNESVPFIRLAIDGASFDSYYKYYWYLLHFFSFAMKNSSYPVKVIATRNDNILEIWFRKPNNDFAKEATREELIFFNYEIIKEKFYEILVKWFELEDDFNQILQIYFDHLYNQDYGFSHKFLNMIQILEGLHRRLHPEEQLEMPDEEHKLMIKTIMDSVKEDEIQQWLEKRLKYSNEINLSKRLKLVFEKYPFLKEKFVLEGLKVRDFAFRTTQTRNYLTHFDKELESVILHYEDMVFYSNLMVMIIDVLILSYLGFGNDKIKDMILQKEIYKYLKVIRY